ncbi:hypothetical protein HYH02_001175 [Chlamydomonas schloesseri]|uniref:Uncharacterized protein n=1 Tax=Chlamydomonas schloesseri TaxID=2026947 RepID=A0A835WTW5_9CHLO|nr:hypothetical protein HYH02_001175 [Chlamydomonas schloesseri]|eukprot:KAG2454139.1 hypothetical protein HYH02_001175 [Chlamydomonas schloesseri]
MGSSHYESDYCKWFSETHVPSGEQERRSKIEWLRSRYASFWETGTTSDRPRSGRPRLVEDELLAAAIQYVSENHFRTQAEYNNTAVLKAILEAAECSTDTLWQRMHEYEPALGKHFKIEYRRTLAEDVVKQRVEQSCNWLRQGVNPNAAGVTFLREGGKSIPIPPSHSLRPAYEADWLLSWVKRIIWIDEKVIYLSPEDHNVWGIGPGGMVIEDIRKLRARPLHIKYISAVNYHLGAVKLVLVSGTWAPDYEPTKIYTVRRGDGAGGTLLEE